MDTYMYNHELDPVRYPLPGPPADPPPERGAASEYWAEGLTPGDVERYRALARVEQHQQKQQGRKQETPKSTVAGSGTGGTGGGRAKRVRFAASVQEFSRDEVPRTRPLKGRHVHAARGAASGTSTGASRSGAPRPGATRSAGVNVDGTVSVTRLLERGLSEGVREARGAWRDIQEFDKLPADTFLGKMQCVISRQTRMRTLLCALGALLVLVCIAAAIIYCMSGAPAHSARAHAHLRTRL